MNKSHPVEGETASIYEELNVTEQNQQEHIENDAPQPTEEDQRLGIKSPIKTILALSIGPLISQTVQAFYGLADSLWVARTIGQTGIAVFGLFSSLNSWRLPFPIIS